MLVLTKKMKEDIAKYREQDIIVCDTCGTDDIQEKMWVNSNNYISIDGCTYYKYEGDIDETSYWCDKCCVETIPVLKQDYKEEE